MVAAENKTFEKVYNKLLLKTEEKIHQYTIKRKYGGKIDYKLIKTLNLITNYLDSINNSEFTYYYIQDLTKISNYLNRI